LLLHCISIYAGICSSGTSFSAWTATGLCGSCCCCRCTQLLHLRLHDVVFQDSRNSTRQTLLLLLLLLLLWHWACCTNNALISRRCLLLLLLSHWRLGRRVQHARQRL
jgi:hypothetical protein